MRPAVVLAGRSGADLGPLPTKYTSLRRTRRSTGNYSKEAHVSITAEKNYQDLTDKNGRVYRVGESPHDLMKSPRRLLGLLPWFGMMGISVSEYAFGSAERTLHNAHGWSTTHIFWLLSIWVFFQAAVAFPAGKLRESGKLSAPAALPLRGGGALLRLPALTH